MHRRKSSKDGDLSFPPSSTVEPAAAPPTTNGSSSLGIGHANGVNGSRTRTISSPSQPVLASDNNNKNNGPSYRAPPPSAGPFRTSFSVPGAANGYGPPASASPYVRSFNQPTPPPAPSSAGLGSGHPHSNSHSRARSVSAFAPASPSPLSASFSVPAPPLGPPSAPNGHSRTRSTVASNGLLSLTGPSTFPTFITSPALIQPSRSSDGTRSTSPLPARPSPLTGGPPPTTRPQRHTRLHSRNLSIFFPQPGSLQHNPNNVIAEDGTQDEDDETETHHEAPVQTIPAASNPISPIHPRRLGEGFTFGGKPPSSAGSTPDAGSGPGSGGPPVQRAQRRGHHHKHSLSHQFFSFLEPGGGLGASVHDKKAQDEELVTNPTPEPMSPWVPISPFTPAARGGAGAGAAGSSEGGGFAAMQGDIGINDGDDEDESKYAPKHAFQRAPAPRMPVTRQRFSWTSTPVLAFSAQFVLGAWIWTAGQGAGSLALTGLGYWVVFDAFGVGVGSVLPGYLERERRRVQERGGHGVVGVMYGTARIETVALFAQAVYLLFAAVYVCKETVEHLLLSIGQEGKEGHHHHTGDEHAATAGIPYPVWLLLGAVCALVGTAVRFGVNGKMVEAAENRVSMSALEGLFGYGSSFGSSQMRGSGIGASGRGRQAQSQQVDALLTNPYTIAPVAFATALLFVKLFLPVHDHRTADLILAFVIAGVTFALAYPASAALGVILLQTSPPRGAPDGVMEAFLRAMRDIERHPQILHLPAPHVWTLAPSAVSGSSSTSGSSYATSGPSVVCTFELHVPRDTDDAGVLALTKWARERVVGALRAGRREEERVVCEVTVGVVKG